MLEKAWCAIFELSSDSLGIFFSRVAISGPLVTGSGLTYIGLPFRHGSRNNNDLEKNTEQIMTILDKFTRGKGKKVRF